MEEWRDTKDSRDRGRQEEARAREREMEGVNTALIRQDTRRIQEYLNRNQ